MELPSVCPTRWLQDQDFAMCMTPHDLTYPFSNMQLNYFRPWKPYNQAISKGFGSTIENEKGNYKITLDVQYFCPNEIKVKVTDYEIIVEGKHDERPDIHGFVTRQFKRRYPLPNHCPPDSVTSTLSSDGVLTIIAERKSSNVKEKIVPIKFCGTCPSKTEIETKIISEVTQKAKDEQKQELLKDIISKTSGPCINKETKHYIGNIKTSETMDQLNMSSTENKIEESTGKSILGLAELKEQFGQNTSASRSEMDSVGMAAEMSGNKTVSDTSCSKTSPIISRMQNTAVLTGLEGKTEMSGKISISERSSAKNESAISGIENLPEISGMKNVPETPEVKRASGLSDIKTELEMSEMRSKSNLCGVTVMSKTSVEESTSSYSSSSSMLSKMSVEGNTTQCISDIREELMEAAENV